MTKPADTSRSLLDTMTGLFSTMSVAPVGSMLVRHALDVQKGIAGEVNQAAHDWLDRRQEAMTSMVSAAQKVMDKGLTDTGSYSSMQEWYAGMLERTAADFKSPYDLMLACSAHVVPQTRKSVEKSAPSIRRAA